MLILKQRRGAAAKASCFLNISVARRSFLLRFGVFLEPSKRDGMMLKIPK